MANAPFYVQLHMHTSIVSKCGQATGAEMARAAWRLGYDLIVVTDHFFTGNCRVKPGDKMPWAEKVDFLLSGYEDAKKEGDKLGLKVLLGWEYSDGGIELNTFGLGKEFLLANPDVCEIGRHEYLERVRRAGGWAYQVHPFREALWLPRPAPEVGRMDAIESYNGANKPIFNERAEAFARAHLLVELAGADAHRPEALALGAMALDWPVTNQAELIAALRSGAARMVKEVPIDARRN